MIRGVKDRDTTDVLGSVGAILGDAVGIFLGFWVATWLRFDSGWVPLRFDRPADLYVVYLTGAGIMTVLFLFIFQRFGLYVRPQIGPFLNKVPRLIRGVAFGILLTMVLAYSVQNEVEVEFARVVIGFAFFTITVIVLLERAILFRVERGIARRSGRANRVLILGVDEVAAHVRRTLSREPMLRSGVVGFLRTRLSEPDQDVPHDLILGTVEELEGYLEANEVDQIILTDPELGHQRILDIILLCERNLIEFNMVPDLFRVMTRSMDFQSLDDIPLLGLSRWPLDVFWCRILKRIEDVVGATLGLILTAPVIAVAAVCIKRTSPGPVFYRQERCGEKGESFVLYKLRTMDLDAESESGPVFAREGDPRVTPCGAFLRRHNLDELPQLWNVLKGEMSLVGPRPERPHFVEQFKDGISRYMWRHVSKPGMTGWAQVNGLRGNTSIEERLKYDLFYLENWSLAFDFKILLKTLFAHQNAY